MAVDVQVEIVVRRPLAEVAAFAVDPANAPAWYANIRSVAWRTQPPLSIGSRMDFAARFLGRTLAYTYEVIELEPGRRLAMSTSQGPFPMRTEYTWEPVGPDATRMTLRNTGDPRGVARISGPLLEAAMRRATTRDLERLAALLEARAGGDSPG